MPVEFRNYYDVLGVEKDATAADIKKAFRKLARQYHPDVAKDKTTANRKFEEISEANEVLSDPEKRRKYDQLGANWNRPGWQTSQQEGGFGKGPEAYSEYDFGGTGFSAFFEQFFGGRGNAAAGFGQAWEDGLRGEALAQRGQDIESDILVTLDEALRGSTRTIRLQRLDPHTGQSSIQTLQVKIPPGVREAQLIRLAGKGQEALGRGASGSLYLRVKFAKHPDFRVQGADLFCELELSPWEAVLGATIDMPTLDGTVSLNVPAGTEAEHQFRLRGQGLPAGDGTRGALYAIVAIQVPSQLALTPAEKALWAQLAAQSTFNPRKAS